MRIVQMTAAVFVAVASAPGAFACHPVGVGFNTPAPAVFWPAPPSASQLKPGESVLRVVFNRRATEKDPGEVDYTRLVASAKTDQDIVIVTCSGSTIYSLVEVVAGDSPGPNGVLVWGLHAHINPANPILVGSLIPLKTTNRDGSAAAADSPAYMLQPRGPPGVWVPPLRPQ